VNSLPEVVTQLFPGAGFDPRPIDRESNALPVAPPRHLFIYSPLFTRNLVAIIETQKELYAMR